MTRWNLFGTFFKKITYSESHKLLILLGGRRGIRTHDLRLRRPTLYPAELAALVMNDKFYYLLAVLAMALVTN